MCAVSNVRMGDFVDTLQRVGGGVLDVKPGDQVIMTYAACGHCPNCAKAKPSYCYDHGSLNFGGTRPNNSTTHTAADGSAVYGTQCCATPT